MNKILLIVSIVSLLFVTVSCGNKNDEVATESVSTETQTTVIQEDIEFYRTDEETFDILTSYGVLKYPTKWQDLVVTEIIEEVNYCEVKFFAVLDGINVPLYSIIIGNSTEGYLLGFLKVDGVEYNVRICDYSAECPDTLSDASLELYIQMSEDVNVVISRLVYDSGMELG